MSNEALESLQLQIRTAAGLQRIRQRLQLPGRLTDGRPPGARRVVEYLETRGAAWCRTCRAEDVTGNHAAYGHEVVR